MYKNESLSQQHQAITGGRTLLGKAIGGLGRLVGRKSGISSKSQNPKHTAQFGEGPQDGYQQENYIGTLGRRTWFEVVGTSDRIPIVILHGGPGLPHDYLEPLAALSDERPVIFYDQLGCGKSDRSSDKNLWTLEYFVEEVERVREALGLRRIHLFGHSWGSTLAVEYALTHPDGIVSLILASPLLDVPGWIDDLKAYRDGLPNSIQDTLRIHEEAGTTNSEAYISATRAFYQYCVCRLYPWPPALQRAGASVGLEVYHTIWGPNEFTCTGNLRTYDTTTRLNEMKVPVLYTCGRFDGARPDTVARFQSITPNSQLIIFEHSAHMAHLEETSRYISVIREFLRDVEHHQHIQ